MKTKSTLTAVALAFAALAAPFASKASTGDIVDIRVVDTDEFTFGDRNILSPNRCTADYPLVAGDELLIRVRMLVRNYAMAAHNVEAPLEWKPPIGVTPMLGLVIGTNKDGGPRAAYAEYRYAGYAGLTHSGTLDTDNVGNIDSTWTFPPWQYYTDFYFVYKVQPGDLGLPVRLMNASGGIASDTDTNTGYYLSCTLQNANGDYANFWYGDEVLPSGVEWPEGIPGDGPLRNYDLAAEGAYLKTVDFDKENVDAGVWRDVYLGMTGASAKAPELIVGGGALAAETTVYIWSDNESVVVPDESGGNEIITVDGKQVLKVLIPKGATSVTFALHGVYSASATVGATATIYLSPTQSAVYRPTGELANITVSRTVRVVRAPIDFDSVNGDGLPYSPGDVWRYVYPGSSEAPATTPTLLLRENASAEATTVYIWSADETVMVPVASGANTIDTSTGKTVLKVPVAAGATSVTFAMKGAPSAAAGAETTVYASPVLDAVGRSPADLETIAVSRRIVAKEAPAPKISIALKVGGIAKEEQTVVADSAYNVLKATLVFSTPTLCDDDVTLDLSATINGGSSLQALYDGNILRIADPDATSVLDGTPLQIVFPKGQYTLEKGIFILGASEATENGIRFSHSSAAVATAGTCTLYVERGGDDHPISVTSFSPDNSQPLECDPGTPKTFNLKLDDTYRSLNDTATGYTLYLIDDDTGDELQTKANVKANPSRKQISWAISFDKSYDGKNVAIYALSPDGLTQTTEVPYTIRVKDSKQVLVSPAEDGVYTIGEGHSYAMALALNQPFSGTQAKYIFLEGATAEDKALFTSSQTSTGASVGPNAPYTASTSATFLDGGSGGTPVAINAFLADSQTDPTDRTAGWSPGSITVTVTNEPPRVGQISVGGAPVMISKGGKLTDPISRGVAKKFALTARDVAADLNATGEKAFRVRWSIDGQEYTTTGNPSGQTVTHTFQNVRASAPVYIWLKDKDMDWESEPDFYFYVDVKDKPHVSVNPIAEGGIFAETESLNSIIDVSLSEPATADIVVRFTVQQVASGFLTISTTDGSVVNAVDGEGKVIPGAYDLTFTRGATTKSLIVSDMDGTRYTRNLSLSARVTTETENADGVKWCDFYEPDERTLVSVVNVEPTVYAPPENSDSHTNTVSADVTFSIEYACTDIPADMTNMWLKSGVEVNYGIRVTVSIDGGIPVLTTNMTDETYYTFTSSFTQPGYHFVTFKFEDKDGGITERLLHYNVPASRTLDISAHGPADAVGSNTGDSMRYALAAGLGAGRVYAGDGPRAVKEFVHSYAVDVNETAISVRAYGYEADGKDDDGSISSMDAAIDEDGNLYNSLSGKAYYNYSNQNIWGKRGFDSFVYAFACNNVEASTSGGSSTSSKQLLITIGKTGSTPIPLPADESKKEGAAVLTYPKQYWEAVFSREFLKSDNCGDINADGVPDAVVYRYGMGIFDETGSVIATGGEGDLKDVSAYNLDLDKDGADSPDFLPSQDTSAYGSLIPGLSGTWVTLGMPFSAKLEVRGYHDGLNDAMIQLGFSGEESDRVYAEGVDDGAGGTVWKWTENCSISELEWYAWTEYAAAHGLDWKDKNNWAAWSPERPTSPILDDTDGDGFDDGYEYYFWYKAHVGYMEGGVHKRLTGRRYDPRNPGDGVLITSEEIELLMDPQVATDAAGALTRDTDNDGLPDLLEYEIGTNPFDFDTDGDGLPDGWELMMAGLNPLLAQSAADAIPDQERNYDGDAMAIASFKLEASEFPPSNHPEQLQYTTFAVIDPDGDSDSVQWYATKAEVAVETDTVSMWAFKLADGTDVVSLDKPLLTDDGRLAATIARGEAFLASGEAPDIVRGWPMRLEAGTPVDATSVADAAVDVSVLKVAEAIAEKGANAAWVYGKGEAAAARGEVAKTAADYGCLALGRQLAVEKGAEIVAEPSDERDVALLHYLVYQQMGFDPRTAWSAKDPLASRWGKNLNGESVEGITIVRPGGYCAHPSHTRAYATYDEFLVYSFFLNNGCDMSGYTQVVSDSAPYLAKVWGAFTTNPQGPNEPGNIQLDPPSEALGAVGWTQYFFGWDSDNGADTDGDGVPDGWELYVMSGPKMKGAFVFAPPYAGFNTGLAPEEQYKMPKSYLSPFIPSAQKNDTNNQIYLGGQGNDDGLNEFQEFESTDAMNHYAEVYDGATTTIVHDGEWLWFNKFFPTNPWNVDTDGDGVSDSAEGKKSDGFIYGTPADDGSRCIVGGGLNPNSVDTDGDGLPDGWELQFRGKTPFPGKEDNGTALSSALADKGNKAKDSDGNEIGNYLQGLVDGMDGTVQDAFNYPITYTSGSTASGADVVYTYVVVDGVNQIVNRDYDHDGLDNWQEYLTGTMRCWRYDDSLSPWIPIPKSAYFGEGGFNPDFDALKELFGVEIADIDDFWVKTLVDKTSPIYNPRLVTDMSSGAQYFSRVTNVWDTVYIDYGLGGNPPYQPPYYWFYHRVGDTLITKDFWPQGLTIRPQPTKYPSCSPLNADSDGDGMDDYYELFHGMNPLLGASGFTGSGSGPCDLVCDAWGGLPEAWGTTPFTLNYWQMSPWKTRRGNGYDFEVFPWLNGIVDADPDGDDVSNQLEALMPNINMPAQHSDPTPLWMTDTSYDYSFVNRFFRLPTRFSDITPEGDGFTDGVNFYEFKDFDTWVPKVGTKEAHFGEFAPDKWNLTSPVDANWMFSFEENEGFDSDHDGLSDREEKEGKFRAATDPLDADSPRRRQAMYFQGPDRPSVLQTMPEKSERHAIAQALYPDDMSFAEFTVECWVRPESLDDSVIVERAVCIGLEHPGDEEHMRKNFQLAIKSGRWYAKFDPAGTMADRSVEVVSSVEAVQEWTHLAATYDGENLVLYVNGILDRVVRSGLQPSYGSAAVAVASPGQEYFTDLWQDGFAIIVGASAKTQTEGGSSTTLDITQGAGWDGYTRFFKGWIDEIRIWDGARTSAEIASTVSTRFTPELAAKNRSDFYDQWADGRRRYTKGNGDSEVPLVAELRYHWAFDSIFGADNEAAVVTSPHGFHDARPLLSRPEGYEIPWWKKVLDGYADTIYCDPAWICWIPNTVAHLPRFDGTTLDSVYWSDGFQGTMVGSGAFAHTAEPVSCWVQMLRNGVSSLLEYVSTSSRHLFVNTIALDGGGEQYQLYEFTGRHLNQYGDDLIPLGGAYVKMCDDDVALWDGEGPSSNWEITGSDADGDGLPDWWEQYADENYRPEGMDPSEEIGWNTLLDYNGFPIIAGEAYLRDLAKGFYLNEAGEIVAGVTKYEQTADEDGSGVPDWWEELYGIFGESGLDDHDNDGLPNFVEYLLSEVFRFEGIMFDPTKACSIDPYTPDYFYRVGSLYVGEIFTDHDLVDDAWEDSYSAAYASRLVYDAYADTDDDGWSNRSEARYAKQVLPIVADEMFHYTAADGLVADYPIPTIALTLRYNGARQDELRKAPIMVMTTTSPGATKDFDAIYSIGAVADAAAGSGTTSSSGSTSAKEGTSYTRMIGKWSNRHALGTLTPGYIMANSLALEFCYDPSSAVYSWVVYYGYYSDTGLYRRGTRKDYDNDKRRYGDYNVVLLSKTIEYEELADLEIRTDETGSIATWVHTKTGKTLGTVNLTTGEFDLDLGVFAGQYVSGTNSVTSLEDQSFRIAYATNPSIGLPRRLYLGEADSGHVREGLNTIVAFADLNKNDQFDEGEPYGLVSGVNVSWKGTSAEIELTDESAVAPRFDLFSAGGSLVATTNVVEDPAGGPSITEPVRVRVVRWKIDDKPIYSMAVAPQVVLDKIMDPRDRERTSFPDKTQWSLRGTLSEKDFIDADTFDLDWDDFYDGVVQNAGVIAGNYKVVKADYLVFFGDGEVSWLNKDETNKLLKASTRVITRYYGADRVLPVPVAPGSVSPASSAMGVVNTANPTFAWTIDCPEREGYTAFRVMVSHGGSTIYDSGVRRAPARDDDGVYRWTAPLYVGDMTTSGKVFANKTDYSWRVAMYNSKYREDEWSASAAFYMNVQTSGHENGSASVGVRYFGPEESYRGKVVRVQAFSSPDFTGVPVAAGYVADTSALAATGAPVAENCRVIGLPAGTYYLLAFIDSNGNGVCDAWESSGYLCARDGTTSDWLDPMAVTIGPDVGTSDLATIYMEDADTDTDGLPDAWEYAKYGRLSAKGVELLSETPAGEALVNKALSGDLELRENAQVPSAGLAGHVRSALSNAGTLALALGVNPAGYDTFAAAISGSVSEKLVENGVKITSLDFADGKVVITVDAETEAGEPMDSPLVANVLAKSGGIDVVARVYWKQSLSDSQWTLVAQQDIVAGAGEATIDAGAAGSGSSGFYKVEVSEK